MWATTTRDTWPLLFVQARQPCCHAHDQAAASGYSTSWKVATSCGVGTVLDASSWARTAAAEIQIKPMPRMAVVTKRTRRFFIARAPRLCKEAPYCMAIRWQPAYTTFKTLSRVGQDVR